MWYYNIFTLQLLCLQYLTSVPIAEIFPIVFKNQVERTTVLLKVPIMVLITTPSPTQKKKNKIYRF